jgi:mono/diheme cytochrome c family protein
MKTLIRSFTAAGALLALAAGIAIAPIAHADGDKHRRTALLPLYQQECASCHVAFPPGLLPASSWQALIDNLPRHFGVDASVDAATQKELATWLRANGANRAATRPPEDRITRTDWFRREHREVSAANWQSAAVKSPANCAACHVTADQGEFNERNVRLPR